MDSRSQLAPLLSWSQPNTKYIADYKEQVRGSEEATSLSISRPDLGHEICQTGLTNF